MPGRSSSIDPELYRQEVKLFVDAGVSVGTHAIGDQAIDWVVDSYAEALRADPKPGLRLSVIHAMLVSSHALAVMADLQRRYDSGIPEVQPEFIWWLGDGFPAAIGQARSNEVIPLHSFQMAGLIWAGGSDAPVTPLGARYGLAASVVRHTLKGAPGSVLGPSEAVDVHAALRSYTIWAARQLFIETETGSLEAGKIADVAVSDRDPYTVPSDALKDIVCEMTLFRGAVVYDRSAGTAQAAQAHAPGQNE